MAAPATTQNSRISVDNVYLLGALPRALQESMAQQTPAVTSGATTTTATASHAHRLTSSLEGVQLPAAPTATLMLSSDAALCMTDHINNARWTARVRLATEKDGIVLGPASSLPAGRTLLIDASTWRSELMASTAKEPATAPATATAAPLVANAHGSNTSSAITESSTTQATNPAQLPSTPITVLAPRTLSAMVAVASPLGPASPTTSAAATLTSNCGFHFFRDRSVSKTTRDSNAVKMNLAEVLMYAGTGATTTTTTTTTDNRLSEMLSDSQEEATALLTQTLILDVVHYLAPAPRTLREVLLYVFGGSGGASSSSAASATTSSVSLLTCPRSAQYKASFSLSDVRHIADLLCTATAGGTGASAATHAAVKNSVAGGQLHQLSGVAYCFLDVDRYESRVDSQRSANRAYPLLAQLLERAPTITDGAAAAAGATADTMIIDVSKWSNQDEETGYTPAYAAAPLVKRYLRLSTVAAQLRSLEVLVDRDTVLAVKSRGGGIMQGLGQRSARPVTTTTSPITGATSGDRDRRKARLEVEVNQHESSDDDGANSISRNGSDNDTDPEEHDQRVRAREQRAAPRRIRQYATLDEVPVQWRLGDLRSIFVEGSLPKDVQNILTARHATAAATAGDEDHHNGSEAQAKRRRGTEVGGGEANAYTGGNHDSDGVDALLPLQPLAIIDAVAYTQATQDYRVLQHFTTTVLAALDRHRDVTREATAWAHRTGSDRLAPELIAAVNAYFAENAVSAKWLADAATAAGAEAYRLGRALRDYVNLKRLGVL